MNWQKLSSKVILNHPRLTVVEDDVILPNGQASTYIRYEEFSDGAVIIAESEANKVLLLREYCYPLDESIWQFPAGGIELGEASIVAAKRELTEEGGIIANQLILLGNSYSNNRRTQAKTLFYHATGLKQAPTAHEPSEQIEIHWKTTAEIRDLISQNEIKQTDTLAAWALYEQLVLVARG
jgi:ADP-ribose pyrophosphatase